MRDIQFLTNYIQTFRVKDIILIDIIIFISLISILLF